MGFISSIKDTFSFDPFNFTGKRDELNPLNLLFGGDSNLEGFKLPDFFEDPEFKKTQEFLSDFGINILKGEIPEFFKPIGEIGGKEFEDVLSLTKRDIEQSAINTGAITGRGRGGSVPSSVASAVGDASTKARLINFQQALEGKGFLLQQGRGITEGVRSASSLF